MKRLFEVGEVAFVTLCFELSIERIWRAFVGEVGPREGEIVIALAVFAVSCVLLGAWIQFRFSRALAAIAAGITLGVILAFVIRAFTGDVPYYRSDLPFLLCLAAVNSSLVFAGAILGSRRNSARG